MESFLSVFRTAVLVVAHPDDESLWFGGILQQPLRWTVICLSVPARDPVRHFKFHDACRTLQVVDSKVLPFSEIEPLRFDALDLDVYDLIVTHGRRGEYGHRQHIETHDFIAGRWPDKTLTSAYGDVAGFTLELSEKQFERKMAALRCYDHHSPTDHGKPKWKALLDVYDGRFDLAREPFRWVSDAGARRAQAAGHPFS